MPTRTPPRKKPPAKRRYDSPLRAEKLSRTRLSILEHTVAALVEAKGGEVPTEEVARRAGISERTVFRFFGDREKLHEALNQYLLSYLRASAEQMSSLSFAGFAKNSFLLFEKHEPLTLAYIFSRFGEETRRLFRRKLAREMVKKILAEKGIPITAERKKKLALISSLVSAKVWHDMREDFGVRGTDAAEAMEWAVTTLMDKL